MKEKPEFVVKSEIPWPSDKRMAEVRAMLDANPRMRKLDELTAIRENRPLTAEEEAEYEEIMKPIRELEKLGDMMA